MLKRLSNEFTEGTYIFFRNFGTTFNGKERKTNTYGVFTLDRIGLGRIQWLPRWRKYSFIPLADTVYEETCLREIAQFCVRETKAHREKLKCAG